MKARRLHPSSPKRQPRHGLASGLQRGQPAQRGATLFFVLMAMAIMLIASVALIRSINSSMSMAGNLAFKRDLINQADQAVVAAMAALDPAGALGSATARATSASGSNYSATRLPGNDQGIPDALLSDTAFATVGLAANDITVAGQGVTVRYVIDRLCQNNINEGASTADQIAAACTVGPSPDARGGSASDPNVAKRPSQVLYRLSVRVTGPRNTQVFLQSTLAL